MGSILISDDGSTNGTFLNGKRLHSHRPVELTDGDRVQLGTNIVFKLVRLDAHDEQFQREMFERTVRDPLTGLYNRTYLLNQIGVLAERSSTQGIGMAVLMLDIDHFKQINDRYGHLAGDDVLRQVAAVIRESTRNEDLVVLWGRGVCRGPSGLRAGPGGRTCRADSLEPRRTPCCCREQKSA